MRERRQRRMALWALLLLAFLLPGCLMAKGAQPTTATTATPSVGSTTAPTASPTATATPISTPAAVATSAESLTSEPRGRIRVLAAASPHIDAERSLAQSVFTAGAGIAVDYTVAPADVAEQLFEDAWLRGTSQYDVFEFDSRWLGMAVRQGAIERLDTPRYLLAPSASLHLQDLQPGIVALAGRYPVDRDTAAAQPDAVAQQPVYALPSAVGTEILLYRRDLLQAAGLTGAHSDWQPPATLDELLGWAQQLTGQGGHPALAFAGGGQGTPMLDSWLPLVYAYGGRVWDATRWTSNGLLNGQQTAEATRFFAALSLEHHVVAPEATEWTPSEAIKALKDGRVSIAVTWSDAVASALGSTPAADQFAATALPGRADESKNVVRGAQFHAQVVALSARSGSKQEAWQYMQWLRAHDTDRALMNAVGSGFVSSRLDLQQEGAGLSEWNRVFLTQDVPLLRDVWNTANEPRLAETVERELRQVYLGRKAVDAALDDATLALEALYRGDPERPKVGGE